MNKKTEEKIRENWEEITKRGRGRPTKKTNTETQKQEAKTTIKKEEPVKKPSPSKKTVLKQEKKVIKNPVKKVVWDGIIDTPEEVKNEVISPQLAETLLDDEDVVKFNVSIETEEWTFDDKFLESKDEFEEISENDANKVVEDIQLGDIQIDEEEEIVLTESKVEEKATSFQENEFEDIDLSIDDEKKEVIAEKTNDDLMDINFDEENVLEESEPIEENSEEDIDLNMDNFKEEIVNLEEDKQEEKNQLEEDIDWELDDLETSVQENNENEEEFQIDEETISENNENIEEVPVIFDDQEEMDLIEERKQEIEDNTFEEKVREENNEEVSEIESTQVAEEKKPSFMEKIKKYRLWIGITVLVLVLIGGAFIMFKDKIFNSSDKPLPQKEQTQEDNKEVSETDNTTVGEKEIKPEISSNEWLEKVELSEDKKEILVKLLPLYETYDKSLDEMFKAKHIFNKWTIDFEKFNEENKRIDKIDYAIEADENTDDIKWVDDAKDEEVKGLSENEEEQKENFGVDTSLKSRGYNGVKGDAKWDLQLNINVSQNGLKKPILNVQINSILETNPERTDIQITKNASIEGSDAKIDDMAWSDEYLIRDRLVSFNEKNGNQHLSNWITWYKRKLQTFNLISNIFDSAEVSEDGDKKTLTFSNETLKEQLKTYIDNWVLPFLWLFNDTSKFYETFLGGALNGESSGEFKLDLEDNEISGILLWYEVSGNIGNGKTLELKKDDEVLSIKQKITKDMISLTIKNKKAKTSLQMALKYTSLKGKHIEYLQAKKTNLASKNPKFKNFWTLNQNLQINNGDSEIPVYVKIKTEEEYAWKYEANLPKIAIDFASAVDKAFEKLPVKKDKIVDEAEKIKDKNKKTTKKKKK